MINILLNGSSGKMGQEVKKQINELPDVTLVAEVNNSTTLSSITQIPDVIIDFSSPQGSINILKYALKIKKPIVIATTGFSDNELAFIENASKFIPIFKSANMSFEINVMADVVSKLALLLKDSDIEIVETHHNNKVDSPSGTALLLADKINSALDNSMHYEYDRHSQKQKRAKNEIGIHSIRGGTEVGKHTVLFLGNNESLEITHSVNSRSIFANGAIKAARFLLNKPAGLYNMEKIIG